MKKDRNFQICMWLLGVGAKSLKSCNFHTGHFQLLNNTLHVCTKSASNRLSRFREMPKIYIWKITIEDLCTKYIHYLTVESYCFVLWFFINSLIAKIYMYFFLNISFLGALCFIYIACLTCSSYFFPCFTQFSCSRMRVAVISGVAVRPPSPRCGWAPRNGAPPARSGFW